MEEMLDTTAGQTPKGALLKVGVKYAILGAITYMLIETLIPFLMGNMDIEKMAEAMEGGGRGGNPLLGFGLTVIKVVAYLFVYFLAIKELRGLQGGLISFGQGFKVAYISVAIKAVLVLIWVFIFFTFIHPTYLEGMTELMSDVMEKVAGDKEGFEVMMEMMSGFFSPAGMAASVFGGTLIGGAVLSLIAAGLGRKEPLV